MRVLFIALIISCSPASTPTKQIEAESSFTGQLAKCVDDNSTRAAADKCADEVRKRWAKDGGTE